MLIGILGVSDANDGKSDGKNGNGRKNFYTRQRVAGAVDD
jgi:hypothetical protein